MSRLILDPQLETKLKAYHEPIELVDDRGNLVGVFIPAQERGPEPQISEEEINRRLNAGGGRKLGDILSDLEKR